MSTIRFGVKQGILRSSTWVTSSASGGANDVYVACREIGYALKVSLHESGKWHFAYLENFYSGNIEAKYQTDRGRFIEQWDRPVEFAPGITLALRIVVPWTSAITPISDSDRRRVTFVPNAPEGEATEFDLVFTDKETTTTGWPGKRGMRNQLLGSFGLSNGGTFWVVHKQIAMPELKSAAGKGRFFKGRSISDLSDTSRLLVFGIEADGSRVIFDTVGKVAGRQTPTEPGQPTPSS